MIYISLTTVPPRLRYWDVLKENLNSLLHQKTNKEYKVIFSIPHVYVMDNNMEYVVPDELYEYVKDNPKLIIERDIPDYGPIVKVIGGVKYANEPNDIIIALDDDHVYHEDMLEFHVKKLKEHPKCAICFTGDCGVDKRNWIDEDGKKRYALFGISFYIPPQTDRYLQIPGHWHSVSYWRYFFHEDFNENVWKLADGDDLIMGYYLKKHRNFAICCVRENETDFRPICHFGRQNIVFPIVKTLGYPCEEVTAGTLIRQKHYMGGNHGYESKELKDFLYDTSRAYFEEE